MFDFTNQTTEQITARLEELRGIGENPGERTAEELEQLAQERAAIDAELERRRAAAAQAALRREQVANGAAKNVRNVAGMNQGEQENGAEARAQEFVRTRHRTIQSEEVRAVLVSGGTIATPTGVSGFNDMPGNGVSSIVDLVSVVDCNGMGSNKVAYVASESTASDQTEGSEAAEAVPTFGYVTITPSSIACQSQISKQAKKQSPLAYQSKVSEQALKALRKKAVALIVSKIKSSALVDTVPAAVNASSSGRIDDTTLRKIVLAYGGNEDVVGNAVLFLNKTDLVAFGDVRGTNEKKAVYEITPDADNPNMGIIKDGGMAVRYCICSGLTACDGTAQSTAAIKTMAYGDPKCFELDLFSDYEVRVSEDFAFTSLMDTIVGDAEIGGDVVVNKGFVMLQIPANP